MDFGLAQSLRMSELEPETPLNPDSCWRRFWIFSKGFFCAKWKMIAGSIEPDLVPIIGPSSGVKPMDVSRHVFPLIAARLTPLPKWQVISFALGFLSSFWAWLETYLWLVPWKP